MKHSQTQKRSKRSPLMIPQQLKWYSPVQNIRAVDANSAVSAKSLTMESLQMNVKSNQIPQLLQHSILEFR